MKNKKILSGIFLSIFMLPIHASLINDWVFADKTQAALDIEIKDRHGNTMKSCRPSLANCSIIVTQGCFVPPDSITITNNSAVVALNIVASSSDPNFNSFIVQNNQCPASLSPGASCNMFFDMNTPSSFSVNNILVKGRNTNSTFFDMIVFICS